MASLLYSEGDFHRDLNWKSPIPLDISDSEFITLIGADITNPSFGKIITSWTNGGLTTYGVADLIQKEKENPGEYARAMQTIFTEASKGYAQLLVRQIQERSKLPK